MTAASPPPPRSYGKLAKRSLVGLLSKNCAKGMAQDYRVRVQSSLVPKNV